MLPNIAVTSLWYTIPFSPNHCYNSYTERYDKLFCPCKNKQNTTFPIIYLGYIECKPTSIIIQSYFNQCVK